MIDSMNNVYKDCVIVCTAILFLFSLNVSLTLIGMDSSSKPLLHVKPLPEGLSDALDSDLAAAVDAANDLLFQDTTDIDFLNECIDALFNVRKSFQYLHRRAAQETNIWSLVNSLNERLCLFANDDFLKQYFHTKGFEDLKKQFRALLARAAGSAFTFYSMTIKQKKAFQEELDKDIVDISRELANICSQIDEIIKGYSEDLIENVYQQYKPRREYLMCLQHQRESEEKLRSREAVPLRSYGSNSSSAITRRRLKNNDLASLKGEVEKLKGRTVELEQVYLVSIDALRSCLSDLDKKVVYLHHHVACNKSSFARIREDIVLDIFSNIAVERNSLPHQLVQKALGTFFPGSTHREKLIFTLQRYICEAFSPATMGSVKGRIWEIAVAFWLQKNNLLSQMGVNIDEVGKSFSKEFDVTFYHDTLYGECKMLNWEEYCSEDAVIEFVGDSQEDNNKLTQLSGQKNVCDSLSKHFVVISKDVIPTYLRTWLKKKNIYFIDREKKRLIVHKVGQRSIEIDFNDLYAWPYYFDY